MLALTRDARRAIIAHAEAGAPEEVCGVLAGRRADDAVRVEAVHRVPNVAARPRTEYRLDPEAQFAAFEAVEGTDDREVVGFYHSHPAGPSRPSLTDEARATWPGYVYVIAALDDEPSVGAWTWTGERFEAEAVSVVD